MINGFFRKWAITKWGPDGITTTVIGHGNRNAAQWNRTTSSSEYTREMAYVPFSEMKRKTFSTGAEIVPSAIALTLEICPTGCGQRYSIHVRSSPALNVGAEFSTWHTAECRLLPTKFALLKSHIFYLFTVKWM